MAIYRIYGAILHKGKQRGRSFVLNEVSANKLALAKKKAENENRAWNRKFKREQYKSIIKKVVELNADGTIKGRKKPRRNVFGFGRLW